MRLLILGGTWFLGRTLAEQALASGWHVTTFSRGRSGHDVPGTEPVRGDRTRAADLERLADSGRWDAVVDTSGNVPEVVTAAARALRGKADRYVYVSTVNAYRGWPDEPLTDDSPTYPVGGTGETAHDAGADRVRTLAEYGRSKAACELAAQQQYRDGRCLILRPGVIVGPYEYVGRLPWLLKRMKTPGPCLAAGDPDRPIQPLDVRDLAAFILLAISRQLGGTMNVTAPIAHATYGELLGSCRDAAGGVAQLIWVEDQWLAAQDITQWAEIPLWRTTPGAWNVSSERAAQAGLTCRPLRETVYDTWAWMSTEDPMPHQRAAEIGIEVAKEQRLLAAWKQRSAQA
jgi:nucleoside-diphosphate-sugar epimerase